MTITMPFIRLRHGDAWFTATCLFDDVLDEILSVSVANATLLPVELTLRRLATRTFTVPAGFAATLNVPVNLRGKVRRRVGGDGFAWPFDLVDCHFVRA